MSDDFDSKFNDVGLFIVNNIFPWCAAAMLLGTVYMCSREDEEYERNRDQSVPVNKTVMVNTKQIDKKITINYDDAKKLLAHAHKSSFIKTK